MCRSIRPGRDQQAGAIGTLRVACSDRLEPKAATFPLGKRDIGLFGMPTLRGVDDGAFGEDEIEHAAFSEFLDFGATCSLSETLYKQ